MKENAKRKIVFLTGTRADYGKIKSVMLPLGDSERFELYIFATGMHMHRQYGYTYKEILKDGFKNVYLYINQHAGTGGAMDITFANTVSGFGGYIREIQPDMVVVHGDRLEALAGAVVAATNNIVAAHIEGGEISGTIDESIRHAVTKMAHIHFVANEASKKRVIQLGENPGSVHIIGSPDIDLMLGPGLPALDKAKERYDIPFDEYGIALFHPVTTSYENMGRYAEEFVEALLESGGSYIVIQPNSDAGREFISEEYQRLSGDRRFRVFPSIRFEYFLTMLKNAKFIVGNSSVGIREAGVYGIPAVDVGDRQLNRHKGSEGIFNCGYSRGDIAAAIEKARAARLGPRMEFGGGNSAARFIEIIS